MKIVCSIATRMASSSLPNKALVSVAGKPLLGHIFDRLENCKNLGHVIVSTTISDRDTAIEDYCKSRNVFCYRGSEVDVLGRLLESYLAVNATIGVVVFGDGPLIDPDIVDHAIELYASLGDYDFVSNDLKSTFPPGMEVEVFDVNALERSAKICSEPDIREHGTLFLRMNPQIFRLSNFEAEGKLCRPELPLEVDTLEDLQVFRAIAEHFKGEERFSLESIIDFIDESGNLAELNKHVPRRWKKYRSS